MITAKKKLGAILVEHQIISTPQLTQALNRQGQEGGRIGTALVEQGALSIYDLARALGAQHGLPHVPPEIFSGITAQLLNLLPALVIAKYVILPIGVQSERLQLVMRDPEPDRTPPELGTLGGNFDRYCAPELWLFYALEQLLNVPRSSRHVMVPDSLLWPPRPTTPHAAITANQQPAAQEARATHQAEMQDAAAIEEIAEIEELADVEDTGEDDIEDVEAIDDIEEIGTVEEVSQVGLASGAILPEADATESIVGPSDEAIEPPAGDSMLVFEPMGIEAETYTAEVDEGAVEPSAVQEPPANSVPTPSIGTGQQTSPGTANPAAEDVELGDKFSGGAAPFDLDLASTTEIDTTTVPDMSMFGDGASALDLEFNEEGKLGTGDEAQEAQSAPAPTANFQRDADGNFDFSATPVADPSPPPQSQNPQPSSEPTVQAAPGAQPTEASRDVSADPDIEVDVDLQVVDFDFSDKIDTRAAEDQIGMKPVPVEDLDGDETGEPAQRALSDARKDK